MRSLRFPNPLHAASAPRKLAVGLLLGVGLLSVVFAWRLLHLQFDYDFEQFFPQGDDETAFYTQFREAFGSDNDFILIGIESPDGIYNPAFLREIDAYVGELEGLPYVDEVISPTRIREPIGAGGSVFMRPLLRWDSGDRSDLARDSARVATRSEYMGTLLSADGKALSITLKHKEGLSKTGCDSLSAAIAQWVAAQKHADRFHLAGRAVAQTYYVNLMQREVMTFVAIGLVLIVLFLWLSFRSWWGILVPLTVVLLAGLWTLGIMELTGKSIDVMTVVLPTTIFVVGMSDVVHILSRYFDGMRSGASSWDALRTACLHVGTATFLTSVTTGIGFLTLLTSRIMPIRDFGIYASVGVVVSYLLAFSLLPAVLILFPAPASLAQRKGMQWAPLLERLYKSIVGHRKAIAWVAALLTLASVAGILRIQVNNRLLEDLGPEDPLRKSFVFFETHFAGVRPFELAVEVQSGYETWDREVQQAVAEVAAYLRDEAGIGSVISTAGFLQTANRLLHGDDPEHAVLPESPEAYERLVRRLRSGRSGEWISSFASDSAGMLRISGKIEDIGAVAIRERMEGLERWFSASHPDAPIRLRVTGTAHLVDVNNAHLAADLVLGLSLSFLAISLLMGALFRNVRMVIISLIPNALPLVFLGGIMGFLGIDLKVSTAIVFTIAFGIAVDDTIHMLAHFRGELQAGRAVEPAMRRTFIGSGKAIILTSIILAGGFISLAGSQFMGTFYIGSLIGLTLILALLADLFLIPLLLLRWPPGKLLNRQDKN
jgi:predicted RND superfamily exporter protein